MALHALCTVFEEEAFLRYALKSIAPYVDTVTCVEGAYEETIRLGKSARSADKTMEILDDFETLYPFKTHLIEANERSDADHRNKGLAHIKTFAQEKDWLLIVDGDEVYEPQTFALIRALTRKMSYAGAKAAYFKSLTFVNDFDHYCEQEFPRLFKLTDDCRFTNDNYMAWGSDEAFSHPTVIRAPNVRFFHYSFCKGQERFLLKKKWWESRFNQPFHYSWHLQDGQIRGTSHLIREFKGKHPSYVEDHPLYGTQHRLQQSTGSVRVHHVAHQSQRSA